MRGITIAAAVLLFGVQAQAGTITEIAPFDHVRGRDLRDLPPVQSSCSMVVHR